MDNSTVPLSMLSNLLAGTFASIAATLVLIHRKNYALYKGVAILLFALGTLAFAPVGIAAFGHAAWFKMYYFSRALLPIFLLLFSEYILKINYHIVVKLTVLSATWVFGVGSWFVSGWGPEWVPWSFTCFLVGSLIFIAVRVIHQMTVTRERILIKYQAIFMVTLLLGVLNTVLKEIGLSGYPTYSDSVFAFIITHGIILIISSGGHSRLNQKLLKLFFILSFGCLTNLVFKFYDPGVTSQNQLALFVTCIGILSLYYGAAETSRNLRELGSARLIARLLNLNLKDQNDFFRQLMQWEEISGLYPVKGTEVEGDLSQLIALFHQAGQVIHRFQVSTLAKALTHDHHLRSGLDIAKYYFVKYDCDSLFQLSDRGDFVSVKYSTGLNPAMYCNEISVMSKIIYSAGFKN